MLNRYLKSKIYSKDFKVKMLEEKEHVEDFLREDTSKLSDKADPAGT